MSYTIRDGGPAFPHGPLGDSITFDDGRTSHQWPACAGMTLRDYFAGQALAGNLEQGVEDDINYGWWHDSSKVAKRAYSIADAMLKARGE